MQETHLFTDASSLHQNRDAGGIFAGTSQLVVAPDAAVLNLPVTEVEGILLPEDVQLVLEQSQTPLCDQQVVSNILM